MWTVENRKRYERNHLRVPKRFNRRSPLAKPGGRKREVNIREVVNGVM
jgi:hypothetical protein